jgi:GTPase
MAVSRRWRADCFAHAGKSTLISVLTSSSLDDGRGAARRKVFRHAHESETGRTSSISQQSICFSSAGRILNNENTHRGVACEQMVHSASKVRRG